MVNGISGMLSSRCLMVWDGAPDWSNSYFISFHFSVACSKTQNIYYQRGIIHLWFGLVELAYFKHILERSRDVLARIISSQKIYALRGLKHYIVEIRGGVTRRDDKRRQTTMEDWATQPLSCWKAEFCNRQLNGGSPKLYKYQILFVKGGGGYHPNL